MDEVVGDFEWDTEKRRSARSERGLDFADVARIDPTAIQTDLDRRRDYGEDRYLSVGPLDGPLVVICWTPRGGRTRIISMRKANDREIRKYQTRAGHP